MSYASVIAGMKAGLEAVTGIKYVLDYEPQTIQDTPIVFLLLDTIDREYTAQGSLYTYHVTATLVVNWQDNDAAEEAIIGLIEPIMTAFDADMTLGGRLYNGAALFLSADAGFAQIGSRIYRIVDFTAEITDLAC
jgi:hypothetical protein